MEHGFTFIVLLERWNVAKRNVNIALTKIALLWDKTKTIMGLQYKESKDFLSETQWKSYYMNDCKKCNG